MENLTGKRLKYYRQKHQYTLKHVGNQLNLDASTISKYENGKRTVDVDTLKRFAEFYNINVQKLLEKTKSETAQPKIYQVQTPLIQGYTKETMLLMASFFIGLAIFAIYPLDVLLVTVVFFGVGMLTRSILHFFIARQRPIHTIKVYKDEQLMIDHTIDATTLKTNLRFENFLLSWLAMILFFSAGLILAVLESPVDLTIFVVVIMANFVVFITLSILNILGKTEQPSMAYDTTNKLLNTLKYRIFHLIVTTSSILMFLYYRLIDIEALANIILYILIVFYTLISQGYVFYKMQFYKAYRLSKHR